MRRAKETGKVVRDARGRILDAAADVMRKLGLVRATTKEIARVAGYSEAAIYKHFKDKDDLFFSVLAERLPTFAGALGAELEVPRARPVKERLVEVTMAALRFYSESMPIAVSVLSEPDTLARQRKRMVASGRGPEKANEAVAAYLRAEQRLGRVSARANVEVAASLLIGACFQCAFLSLYHGQKLRPEEVKRLASEIVTTLLDGLTASGARPS
jgi:AcrR family transcriptional regulator